MKLVFAGTPQVAAEVLVRIAREHEVVLAITRPDAPTGRRRELKPSPVAQTAAELGIPVLKTDAISAAELRVIEAVEAELAIVVAYGSLIREPALSALRWWNLHFSVLPQWRGATPLQHSIWHNQGQGITVFELDSGMDTGPIIDSQSISLEGLNTVSALPFLADRGTQLLVSCLQRIPTPTPQQGEVSYAPKITRDDARLKFAKTAAELARMIRALNPEPMAWATRAGNTIRIIDAQLFDGPPPDLAEPGSLAISKDYVLVACGENTWLQLNEVQPAGKSLMSALDWARGINGEAKLD